MLINEEQQKKVRELLRYLAEHNTYYKGLLEAHDIQLADDDIVKHFKKIPFLTKEIIRKNYSSYITSTNDDKLVYQLTSGTEGIPLRCVKSLKECFLASKFLWRERRKWDSSVTPSNFISLFGYKYQKNPFGDFTDFELQNMRRCFGRLLKSSPRWISGSMTIIEKYAREIEKGNLDYNNSIQFIELVGEKAEAEKRKYLESIFNCKTINHYGTRESWCIAFECPHKSLHVIDELFIVETGNSAFLEKQQIIITSLYNKVMPLIRYNTKDIGRVSQRECCGRKSLIIDSLDGRVSELIRGQRGILGDIFFKRIFHNQILQGYNCVECFRVEQHQEDHFKIFIVKANNFTNLIESNIMDEMRPVLGNQITVEFNYVENIPLLNNGKQQVFCVKY